MLNNSYRRRFLKTLNRFEAVCLFSNNKFIVQTENYPELQQKNEFELKGYIYSLLNTITIVCN